MIPLDKIGEYTDACELFNICCSIRNKLEMLNAVATYLGGPIKLGKLAVSSEGYTEKELLAQKLPLAMALLRKVHDEWEYVLNHLHTPAKEALEALEQLGRRCESKLPENLDDLTLLDLVQNHYLRISWKKEVLRELNDIYAGDAFEAVRSEIVKIHDRVLRGRVFIALHMHAGDGNVHTNIPVNSDNVEMIKTANEGVAYVIDRKSVV